MRVFAIAASILAVLAAPCASVAAIAFGDGPYCTAYTIRETHDTLSLRGKHFTLCQDDNDGYVGAALNRNGTVFCTVQGYVDVDGTLVSTARAPS